MLINIMLFYKQCYNINNELLFLYSNIIKTVSKTIQKT